MTVYCACWIGNTQGWATLCSIWRASHGDIWNGMWATLQIGTSHPTFNYAEMAGQMFGGMEQQL
ncbi:hypothetical protein J2T14_002088 [Paenibacillus harenae]|nr:hypothetical protein [Paenibacillus harenae]